MLNLLFFGRPTVYFEHRKDQSIHSHLSDKGMALLAYLALNPGEHSRESLAGLLWGELSAERAKANLRFTLHHLAKLMPDYWLLSRRTAGFDHERPHQIDLVAFHAQVKHDVSRNQAIELARGEFLEGLYIENAIGFEEWLRYEREVLVQELRGALQKLAHQYEQNGEIGRAAQMARRQIHIDPFNEGIYRTLMRLYAMNGEFNEALRVFRECETALQDELSLSPVPETVSLAERVRRLRERPQRVILLSAFNAFIGREQELGQIAAFFQKDSGRLLTITGPGGVGKTRLALAAGQKLAARFMEGVVLVRLGGVHDVTFLPQVIADQLADSQVIVPLSGGKPADDHLVEQLKQLELLLILDNFEQLVPQGTAFLSQLLEKTAVSILVTSRRRINSRWEQLIPLGGLSYPVEVEPELESYEAVHLLATRVRQFVPNVRFDDVDRAAMIQLCRLTDGLPLALELAVAWVDDYSLGEIAAAIEQGIDLLRQDWPDMPPRQRSIQATFDYSWALLAQEERMLLAHLALFERRIPEVGAQAVYPFERSLMQKLIHHSLVRREDVLQKQPVYELHPLVKMTALGKLTEAEIASGRQRLVSYYVPEVETIQSQLKRADQQQALSWIAVEMGQLQVVWEQLLREQDLSALAVFNELFLFYFLERGGYRDGGLLFETAIDRLKSSSQTTDKLDPLSSLALAIAQLTLSWARLAFLAGETAKMIETLDYCETVFTAHEAWYELGLVWRGRSMLDTTTDVVLRQAYAEKSLMYLERAEDSWEIGRQLINLTIYEMGNGQHEQARRHLQQAAALFEELGGEIEYTRVILFLGGVETNFGRYKIALKQRKEALARYQSIQDRWGEGLAWLTVASTCLYMGDVLQARAAGTQAYEAYQALSYPAGMAGARAEQGLAALVSGDLDHVRLCLAEKDWMGPLFVEILEGRLAYQEGDLEAARRHLTAAVGLCHETDQRRVVQGYYDLGWVAYAEGDLEEAEHYFEQSLAWGVKQKLAPYGMYGIVGLAACRLAQEGSGQARQAAEWLRAVMGDSRTHYAVRVQCQQLLGEAMPAAELQPFDWLAVARPLVDGVQNRS